MTSPSKRDRAERDLPLVRSGVDPMPTSCSHCSSSLLSVHEPTGADRFGLVSCVTCGREVCRFTARPRRGAPASGAAVGARSLSAPPGETGAGAPRPSRPTRCSLACHGPCHDAATHEDYGRRELLDDIVARPWAYGIRGAERVEVGRLVVDLASVCATLDGEPIYFAMNEWLLLACLARRAGQVVEHLDLIEAVWGTPARRLALEQRVTSMHQLTVQITRTRRRLGAARSLLVTVPGLGYVLREGIDDAGRAGTATVPRMRRDAGVSADAERQVRADQSPDRREPLYRLPAPRPLERVEAEAGAAAGVAADASSALRRRRSTEYTRTSEAVL